MRLKSDNSAKLRVLARFETELQFVLRPDEFRMLTQIGNLFVSKATDAEYYVKKMQRRIDESVYYGKVSQLNKSAIIDQYSPGVAVLERVGNLAFFDDRDSSKVTNFDIEGCHLETNCEITGSLIRLINKHSAECLL